MTNVLSFPAQPTPEEDAKQLILSMLDNMRKLVEKGEIDICLIQGCGPAWEYFGTHAGRSGYVMRQGLLGTAMKDIQTEMVEVLGRD